MSSKPIYIPVDGAPIQPHQKVRIVGATDQTIYDVSEHIGRLALVEYLEYECGAGQRYQHDPMIGVRFTNGAREEFWAEELEVVK